MTHTYSNQNLFGIKDPNIKFTSDLEQETYRDVLAYRPSARKNSTDMNQKVLTVCAHLDNLPSGCDHCGCVNNGSHDMVRNGRMKTAILIGQYNFQPVYLKLEKQRYLCKHCRKTTVAKTPFIQRHCCISNPIKHLIREELAEIQSMKLIAQHLNVSTNTVIRELERWGDNLRPRPSALPIHLAIDEFKSVKHVTGSMSCILMNNHTHEVIDILEDRTQGYLRDYFLRFSREERLKVQTITMDMYSPYHHFLPSLFPNAEIIIDRFHIIQLLHRVLNQHRIGVMNHLKYQQPRDYRKLKQLWKLLLKPREALDFEHYHTHRLFDGLITEKGIVSYLTQLDSRLLLIYTHVHRIVEAVRRHSFKDFMNSLEETKKYVFPKSVRTAFNTLFKYRLEIEHSLKYTLSNGVVEGTVNKIKMIKRSGYGYRNFGHLRCRILISTQFKNINPQPPRHLYFSEEEADRKYNLQKSA